MKKSSATPETKKFLEEISKLSTDVKLITKSDNDIKKARGDYKKSFLKQVDYLMNVLRNNVKGNSEWNAKMHSNIGTTLEELSYEIKEMLVLDDYYPVQSPTHTKYIAHCMTGSLVIEEKNKISYYLGPSEFISKNILKVISSSAKDIGLVASFSEKDRLYRDEKYLGRYVFFKKKEK